MVCCYWKGKAFIVWVIVGKSLDLACQKNWSECRMEFYIVAFLFPLNGHCCIERGVSLGLCGIYTKSITLSYAYRLSFWFCVEFGVLALGWLLMVSYLKLTGQV